MSTIFITLHRIGECDSKSLVSSRSLTVSEGYLNDFIKTAKSHGYKFQDIDSAIKNSKNQRDIVVTIDDGYLDNKEAVYGLFSDRGVPVCIYITTGFIDKQYKPWWVMLENIIKYSSKIKLPNGKVSECRSTLEKNVMFLKCRKLILGMNLERFMEYYGWLVHETARNGLDDGSNMFLSWNDISEMSRNHAVVFGSHTISHSVLSRMNSEFARSEIDGSKSIIYERVGVQVKHFASPYGDKKSTGFREIDIASDVGYKSISTMNSLSSNLDRYSKICVIPRIGLNEGDGFEKVIGLHKKILFKSRICGLIKKFIIRKEWCF
jgi:peptidoglycan/xylan/chitin deacetylase (PgdA/CDA1 family)